MTICRMIRCQIALPIPLGPGELGRITMQASDTPLLIEFPHAELPASPQISIRLAVCARQECRQLFVATKPIKKFCSDICQELEKRYRAKLRRADLLLPESGEAHNRTDSSGALKCSDMITVPTISKAASRTEPRP